MGTEAFLSSPFWVKSTYTASSIYYKVDSIKYSNAQMAEHRKRGAQLCIVGKMSRSMKISREERGYSPSDIAPAVHTMIGRNRSDSFDEMLIAYLFNVPPKQRKSSVTCRMRNRQPFACGLRAKASHDAE
jgi:hypothetical protein